MRSGVSAMFARARRAPLRQRGDGGGRRDRLQEPGGLGDLVVGVAEALPLERLSCRTARAAARSSWLSPSLACASAGPRAPTRTGGELTPRRAPQRVQGE